MLYHAPPGVEPGDKRTRTTLARLRLTVRHGHHSLPPACIRNPTLFNMLDGLSKWSVLSVSFRPAFTEGASTHVCSLALPTEPVRGLAHHPAVPLLASQTGFDLFMLSAIPNRYDMVAAFPGRATRPVWWSRTTITGVLDRGIAVMLTRDMEPGVGLEPTARCLQGNCSDH